MYYNVTGVPDLVMINSIGSRKQTQSILSYRVCQCGITAMSAVLPKDTLVGLMEEEN